MGLYASTLDGEVQDSALVRSTFRLLIQHAIVLGGVMTLVQSAFFWIHGDPAWRWTAAIGTLLAPLYPLAGVQRSYPVFMAALSGFLIITIVALTGLSLRYGTHSDFHLVLLAVAPAIMVAGRISLRAKWLLLLCVSALIFWLDQNPMTPWQFRQPSPDMMLQLRASNLAATLLMLSTLILRYFLVIARSQRKLLEYAALDSLTGLCNRRHFLAAAAKEVARSERYGGPLCLALADLDHFKEINDRFGHDAGDTVLRHTSQLIRRAARNADCVCRWGGEEFLVLLPQTGMDGAMHIAERIRSEVAGTSLQVSGQVVKVSLTLGVAMLKPGEAVDSAISRADKALYAGKAAGRNRAVPATA